MGSSLIAFQWSLCALRARPRLSLELPGAQSRRARRAAAPAAGAQAEWRELRRPGRAAPRRARGHFSRARGHFSSRGCRLALDCAGCEVRGGAVMAHETVPQARVLLGCGQLTPPACGTARLRCQSTMPSLATPRRLALHPSHWLLGKLLENIKLLAPQLLQLLPHGRRAAEQTRRAFLKWMVVHNNTDAACSCNLHTLLCAGPASHSQPAALETSRT